MSQQTTTISTSIPAPAKPGPTAPRRNNAMAASAAKLSTIVSTWIARRAERRALWEFAESNDHLLKDIGVTREQAQHMAAKWFWQP